MKRYQNTSISTEMFDEYDNEDDTFEVSPESVTYEAKEYKVQNTNEEE